MSPVSSVSAGRFKEVRDTGGDKVRGAESLSSSLISVGLWDDRRRMSVDASSGLILTRAGPGEECGDGISAWPCLFSTGLITSLVTSHENPRRLSRQNETMVS
mgnify:CR=1 FL=1